MRTGPMLLRFCLLLALTSMALTGCASFAGKELPRYGYEQLRPSKPHPSVDYELKAYALGQENPQALSFFNQEVQRVFAESRMFERFGTGIGGSQHHFSFVLKNTGNIGVAIMSGVISGLTMTILPGYARDEYTLTVDVMKDGALKKRYTYNHYMDTWIELFLIVLTPTHSPNDVAREVIDDMLKNFLYDLEKDRIMENDKTSKANPALKLARFRHKSEGLESGNKA